MYGYVIPDKPNMFIKDFYEFKAYYCGFCKSLKDCSNLMRFTTNYDITFLNAFLHGVTGSKPVIRSANCVMHPLGKRDVVVSDELTKKCIDFNNILTYYKIVDDRTDGKSRPLVEKTVRRHFRKSKAKFPEIERITREGYERLRSLEKEGSPSVDAVSDCFGVIMRDSVKELIPDCFSEDIGTFCYQLGKWIYVMDAIDDFDDDVKSKNYNPFICAYGHKTKAELVEKEKGDLNLLTKGIYKIMVSAYDKINLSVSEGITTNTVYYGIPFMTDRVLRSEKCKKIRL